MRLLAAWSRCVVGPLYADARGFRLRVARAHDRDRDRDRVGHRVVRARITPPGCAPRRPWLAAGCRTSGRPFLRPALQPRSAPARLGPRNPRRRTRARSAEPSPVDRGHARS